MQAQDPSFLPTEQLKPVLLHFLKAEQMLLEKMASSAYQKPTPEEILKWIETNEIKAISSDSNNASQVRYGSYLGYLNIKCCQEGTGLPSVMELLCSFYYVEDEIAKFKPHERWLLYCQVVERWNARGLSDERINAVLLAEFGKGHWRNYLIFNQVNPQRRHEQLMQHAKQDFNSDISVTLNDVQEGLFALSDIKSIEKQIFTDPSITYQAEAINDGPELSVFETSNNGPKGSIAGERQCQKWFTELMKPSDSKPDKNKSDYLEEAMQKFNIGKRGALRAWDNAKLNSGNPNWGKPGPKR